MDTKERLENYIRVEMKKVSELSEKNHEHKNQNEKAIKHCEAMTIRYEAEIWVYRRLLYQISKADSDKVNDENIQPG